MFNRVKKKILKVISWKLKQEIKEIEMKIDDPQISIVSFDIFDTLVLRPVLAPEDVFEFVKKEINMNKRLDYINARRSASNAVGADADMDRIYNELQSLTGLSENECKVIKEKEIQIEKQLTYKRNSIYSLYQYAIQRGKKVIAISDMYLSSKILRDILNKSGYTEIKEVYVSSEIGIRKDQGGLFKYVLESEKVSGRNIIHVGDNFVSDYVMALRAGWKACYYPSTSEIAAHARVGGRKLFDEKMITDWAVRIMFGISINYCFDNPTFSEKRDFEDVATFSAFVIFPVVFSTVSKIINDGFIQDQYQRIYFISRDGFLPQRVYKEIGKKKSVIDSRYIYASRRAYQYLVYTNAKSRMQKEKFSNQFTYWDFVKSIILKDEDLEQIKKCYTEEELELKINLDRERCMELLDNSDLIESVFNIQKRFAQKYYKSNINDYGKRKLVFDCGYNGSISIALRNVSNGLLVDKVYLWDTQTNQENDREFKTRSFLVLGGTHPSWAHVLYETCLSSFEGSCIGFNEDPNAMIYPYIQKKETNRISDKIVNEIQNNVEVLSLKLVDVLGFLFQYIIVNDEKAVTCNTYRILDNCSQRYMGILNDIQFGDSYQNVQNNSLGYIISGTNHSLDHLKRKFIRILQQKIKK